jgi:hypothetical protein
MNYLTVSTFRRNREQYDSETGSVPFLVSNCGAPSLFGALERADFP